MELLNAVLSSSRFVVVVAAAKIGQFLDKVHTDIYIRVR